MRRWSESASGRSSGGSAGEAAQLGGAAMKSGGSSARERRDMNVGRSISLHDSLHGVRKRMMVFTGLESRAEREREREREDKEEKERAAAWAWYQHGKGGKESTASGGGVGGGGGLVGSISTLSVRYGEPGHKSSRFKTEAASKSANRSASAEYPRAWDFSPRPSAGGSSSLLDNFELDSVSRSIDIASLGEGFSAPPSGLPQPTRPPGAFVPNSRRAPPPQMNTVSRFSHKGVPLTPSDPPVNRSRSFRLQLPRTSLCRSTSDVVEREEMSLGADISKCDCQKSKVGRHGSGSWSFRRLSRAVSELIHLPDCEYHPQKQHHERRQARLHQLEYRFRHPRHDYDYYHRHLHYEVKLREGVHHGNLSPTKCLGKSDASAEVAKEKDHLFLPLLSPKMSPKVSPKLF